MGAIPNPNRKVLLVVQADSAAAQTVATQQFAPGSGRTALDGFESFFRSSYREVVRRAMIAGATFAEAEDAASETFVYMLQKWPVNRFPLRYARRAVVSNFIKNKTRGTARVSQRLIERGPSELHEEGAEDTGLNTLEGHIWVADVLSQLKPAKREVMERVADGLTIEEIAEELGKSRDVVRRRLCDARKDLRKIMHPDGSTASQPRPVAKRPPREETS